MAQIALLAKHLLQKHKICRYWLELHRKSYQKRKMADSLIKIPPQAVEAERAVLGAMLLYPNLREDGLRELQAEMFVIPSHKLMFERIIKMTLESKSVDALTLAEELRAQGELERAGNTEYIASLVDSIYSPAHFSEYVELVSSKALLRRVLEICNTTIETIFRAPGDADRLIDDIESKFFDLSEKRIRNDFVAIGSIVHDEFEKVQQIQKGLVTIKGTSTHYTELDKLITGFHGSDYIVLAGRTSAGKTAFALSFARNIAIRADESKKEGVALFSLEMSKESMALRILACEANVSAHRMRNGTLSKDEINELSLKVDRVATAPIFIDDTPGITVMEMRSKLRRLIYKVNIKLVIIDYMQLVTHVGRADNRQAEVAAISRALKGLAREFNITVLALAQLSRRVEDAKENRPQLSHLRESGAIEQDADVVLLLYRPEVHGIDTIEIGSQRIQSEGLATLIVAKQRNGPIGDVHFVFNKDSISFEEYAGNIEPPPIISNNNEDEYIPEFDDMGGI